MKKRTVKLSLSKPNYPLVRFQLLLLSFLLLSLGLDAQPIVIDSLWLAVEQAPTLPEKTDELNYLAEYYHDVDPMKAIEISRQALGIADSINYQEGIFYAYNNLGTAFDGIGQEDSSYHYFDRALVLGVELEDEYALSVVKNNFGLYYLFRGNYQLALKYFQESVGNLEDPGYYLDLMVTYNNIGVIHEEQGNIEKAITYYQKAGEEALQYEDKEFAYLSFGYIEQLRKDYDKAIAFYENALEISRANKEELSVGEGLYYLGECYLGKGEYSQAREYLLASLDIYHKLGMIPDEVEIYRTIATVYEAEGKNDAALSLYQQAVDLAEESDLNTILVPVFRALARQYALKQEYKTAYQYLLRYQALNDTIYNNETKERIAQLEMSYELEVSKAERERLQAEQAEREALVRQRTILATGSTIVTVLLAVLLIGYYRANRQKKLINKVLEKKVKKRTFELELVNNKLSESNEELARVNHKLLESNQELERFTYIASHDLKEPLRNITSFIKLIQRKMKDYTDADLKEYLRYVSGNARQMYNMIEDILKFSRITTLDVKGNNSVELNALMIDVEAALSTLIRNRQAQLKLEQLPSIKSHKTHIFMVFKNLIENAIKYNESKKPSVCIRCQENENHFHFFVKDNGIGIDPKYQEYIFEMFQRMNRQDKYEGTGIGLATCKKIITKYGGTITVESQEGQGSTFHFTWPK